MRWFNDFAWTYDPRQPGNMRTVPFRLFDAQAEYIIGLGWCVRHKVRSATKKSRDMGVTWLNAGFDAHQFTFEDDYKAGVGSRKEDLVDLTGNADCIFWKIRFLLDRLPGWMLPGYESAHMRVYNPARNSAITGEAGKNIGRGGRNTRYTVDESAFIENPGSVERALSENTDVRNDTSTPNGPAGPFADNVQREDAVEWAGAEATPKDAPIVIFTLHWRDHPAKDEGWYERKKASIGDPIIIAQELDIDFSASITGIIIPAGWIQPANGRPTYEQEVAAICIGGDIAEDGADFSAAVVREGRNLVHAEEWRGHELTETTGKFIALGLEYEKWLAPGHKLYFFLDKIGVGAGVVSNLRAYVKEHGKTAWVIVGVQVGESAPEQDPACLRLKDVLWWRTRRFFQDQAPSIAPEIDRKTRIKMVRELSSPTYMVNLAGKVVTESKKDLRKRGVASPNLADALIHTFFWEAMKPKADETPKWLRNQAATQRGSRVG